MTLPAGLAVVATFAAWFALQETAPTRVPDRLTCPSCRIELTPVARLGEADGPGSFTMTPSGVRVDSKGRFVVIGGRDGAAGPAVFDQLGRYVGVLGPRGQGPGEFMEVDDAVILPGDSILVLDSGTRRATIVGPDLKPVRYLGITAPMSHAVVLAWPGSLAGFSHRTAAGLGGGRTLHTMAFDATSGSVIRSFGPLWSEATRGSMQATLQRLAPSTSGLWSAWQRRYRIDHWNSNFELDQRLEREPSWFVGESPGIGSWDRAPSPMLTAVQEDDRGRLWAFVATAAPTWKDAWPPRPAPGVRGVRMAEFSFEKLYRTTVEVIDPVAGRVIARRELDQLVTTALPGLLAVLYTADNDGIVSLQVVRLSIQQHSP